MAGHIVFAGMNINNIINEINVNKPQNHNTSSYVGADGSTTNSRAFAQVKRKAPMVEVIGLTITSIYLKTLTRHQRS